MHTKTLVSSISTVSFKTHVLCQLMDRQDLILLNFVFRSCTQFFQMDKMIYPRMKNCLICSIINKVTIEDLNIVIWGSYPLHNSRIHNPSPIRETQVPKTIFSSLHFHIYILQGVWVSQKNGSLKKEGRLEREHFFWDTLGLY